jgi:hypothetical protein
MHHGNSSWKRKRKIMPNAQGQNSSQIKNERRPSNSAIKKRKKTHQFQRWIFSLIPNQKRKTQRWQRFITELKFTKYMKKEKKKNTFSVPLYHISTHRSVFFFLPRIQNTAKILASYLSHIHRIARMHLVGQRNKDENAYKTNIQYLPLLNILTLSKRISL